MNGKDLLVRVKFLIGNDSMDVSDDISIAYTELVQLAPFRQFEQEDTTTLVLEAGESEYALNLIGVRRLLSLSYSSDGVAWFPMESLRGALFDQLHSGQYRVDSGYAYTISGSPFSSIKVFPTPTQSAKIKIRYVVSVSEKPFVFSNAWIPAIPSNYHYLIAKLAAGSILQRSDNPTKIQLGTVWKQEALDSGNKIIWDTQQQTSFNTSIATRKGLLR